MPEMPAARAKVMQEMLNQVIKPKPPLEVDGILGPLTRDAIKLLQKRANLRATGDIDGETAIVIVRAIKTGRIDKDPPTRFIRIDGKYVGLTDKEYDRQLKVLIRDLRRGPLLEMKLAVAAAEAEWQHFDELNRDQWFVSFCVETTSGSRLPNKGVIDKARNAHSQMEKLAEAGKLDKFAQEAPKAARIVNDALDQMRAYREEMVEGGGNWVTGLEITKWTSFTILSVYAAPVAGAALGATALETAVVGGAALAMTESAAGEIGNWSADNRKWKEGGALSRVLIDGAVGAIMGYIAKGASGGKHLVEAASAALVKRLAKTAGLKALSEKTLSKIAVYLLTEGAKGALETAVKDAAKGAKDSKSMTLETFIEDVIASFAKSLALAPIGKVIEKWTEGRKFELDPKDRKTIEDDVIRKLHKELDGKTMFVDTYFKEIQTRIDKVASDMVAKHVGKVADKAIDEIFAGWKGPMSPDALDKAFRDWFMKPADVGVYATDIAADVAKAMKKKHKDK